MDAISSLFPTLSPWEPSGDLMLDISVYSPSDPGLIRLGLSFFGLGVYFSYGTWARA